MTDYLEIQSKFISPLVVPLWRCSADISWLLSPFRLSEPMVKVPFFAWGDSSWQAVRLVVPDLLGFPELLLRTRESDSLVLEVTAETSLKRLTSPQLEEPTERRESRAESIVLLQKEHHDPIIVILSQVLNCLDCP